MKDKESQMKPGILPLGLHREIVHSVEGLELWTNGREHQQWEEVEKRWSKHGHLRKAKTPEGIWGESCKVMTNPRDRVIWPDQAYNRGEQKAEDNDWDWGCVPTDLRLEMSMKARGDCKQVTPVYSSLLIPIDAQVKSLANP